MKHDSSKLNSNELQMFPPHQLTAKMIMQKKNCMSNGAQLPVPFYIQIPLAFENLGFHTGIKSNT